MGVLIPVLTVLFLLVCLLMILIIIVQPHRGEGLAGAFGGVGSESFFGAKAISQAVWITTVLCAIYLILAVGINKLSEYAKTSGSVVEQGDEKPRAPETPSEPR